jgi:hypothetical protein
MIVTVTAVHPTTVIVTAQSSTYELPRAAFATTPTVGQEWTIHLSHEHTEEEQRAALNALLPRNS